MIRMRQGSIWLILVCVFAFYGSAEAKGFYFGASLGQGEAKDLDLSPIGDGSTLTGGTDGTDSGWKFFGGVKVFRFMNAEFSYRDYGQAAFSATSDGAGTIYAPGPVEGLTDTTAITVSAMVVVGAGRFKVFAKGGAARWRSETTIQHSMGTVAARNSDGVDAMYGLGLAFGFKKGSTGVRVEYERIATDAADRDFISAGVHFKF